ncbi:MAG TPA: TetR/AcrR family transcriptional regulator [Actinomycetes bacterium]|nr:TetR/AcrR family transcriptional regulator [Actinomycetes bacterium]
MSLRHLSVDAWPTRDRILYEASRLIAARGYHGATTRDIADGVGIKQPSMFNHFPSKQAILEELLVFDLTIPGARAEQLSFESSPPAVRLYRYAAWDLRWYQEMPYDLRGMHEDLLALPGLESFRTALERWNEAIARILDQGIGTGEFRADAAPFIPALLDTLSWEFVRSAHKEAVPDGRPYITEDGASFVLRGLLSDPDELVSIRDAATLADKVVT